LPIIGKTSELYDRHFWLVSNRMKVEGARKTPPNWNIWYVFLHSTHYWLSIVGFLFMS